MNRTVVGLAAWLRHLRWRMRLVRCGCGEHRIAPGTGLESGGIRHRTDGPCYFCDEYGQPAAGLAEGEAMNRTGAEKRLHCCVLTDCGTPPTHCGCEADCDLGAR